MTRTDTNGVIGIGVVGGGFGGYGLTPGFRRDPRCEVRAIATGSETSGAAAAARFGIERACNWSELIAAEDIQAIAIASPPLVQAEIALAALQAGKAVFVEKLLATDSPTGRRLVDAARRSGVANMVDFIFPELTTWQRLRALLDEGAVGGPRHIFLDWRMESFDVRTGKRGWKTDASARGGVLSHFGIHALHYLEWLFGPAQALSARLTTAPGLGMSGDTLAVLTLEFQSGASAAVTLSNAAFGASSHCLQVHGTDAALQLCNRSPDPVDGFVLERMARGGAWERVAAEDVGELARRDDKRVLPVSRLATRFVDWMTTGTPSHPDFSDGLRALELLEAALESSSAGGVRRDLPPRTRS